VREIQDESFVFSVRHWIGWWRRTIEVYDADDHLVGCGETRGTFSVGFWIYDRRNLPFVEMKASFPGGNWSFRAVDGRELGKVEWNTPRAESRTPVDVCVLSIGDELAEQPLAKMLLLGAALAMNLAYHRESK
jgi:hypothetical protein